MNINHDDATGTTTNGDAGDQQQWIDQLLRSSDAADLEAAPATARIDVASVITRLRRRKLARQSLAVFATAAAAIIAMATWSSSPLPGSEGPGEGFAGQLLVQAPDARQAIANPAPSPSLPGRGNFVANGDAIAIPLESPAPNVTVVQLYPTTIAERRLQNELSFRKLLINEPNGG